LKQRFDANCQDAEGVDPLDGLPMIGDSTDRANFVLFSQNTVDLLASSSYLDTALEEIEKELDAVAQGKGKLLTLQSMNSSTHLHCALKRINDLPISPHFSHRLEIPEEKTELGDVLSYLDQVASKKENKKMENWGSSSKNQYVDYTNTTKFLETLLPSPPPLCKNSLITYPSQTSQPITDTTTNSIFKTYSRVYGGRGRGRGGYGGRGGRGIERNDSNLENPVEEYADLTKEGEDDEEGWALIRREKKKIADSCGYEHALLTGIWAGKDKKTLSLNLVTETTDNFLDTHLSLQKNDTIESSMGGGGDIREETFIPPSLIQEQEIAAESPKVSGILFSGSDVAQREIRNKSNNRGGGKQNLSRFTSLVKQTLVTVQPT